MLQSNNDNGTGYLIDSKLFKLYERGNCSVIYSLISQKKMLEWFHVTILTLLKEASLIQSHVKL